MSSDATAFLAEIDGRVSGYLQEIRERAASVKADLEAGTLRASGGAPSARSVPPPADDAWAEPEPQAQAPADDGFGAEADRFDTLSEPTNGSHPLDAPIFGDTDSFLSDDLDFSIDLDDSLPI